MSKEVWFKLFAFVNEMSKEVWFKLFAFVGAVVAVSAILIKVMN